MDSRAAGHHAFKQLRARLLKQGIAVTKSSIARFRDHLFPEEAAARRARRKELSRLMLDLSISRSGQVIGNDDSAPQGSDVVNLIGT